MLLQFEMDLRASGSREDLEKLVWSVLSGAFIQPVISNQQTTAPGLHFTDDRTDQRFRWAQISEDSYEASHKI